MKALPFLKRCIMASLIVVVSSCAHVEKKEIAAEKQEEENYALGDDAYSSLTLLMHVMQMVHENYVDLDEATYKQLIDDALKGMVLGLDPYCQYFEPKIYGEVEKENTGQFGGIGVIIRMKEAGLEMVKVNQGGPAEKAGIKDGDFIVEIEGESIKGADFRECLDKLKGRPETVVEVTVYRESDKKNHNLLITREVIKISPISAAKFIQDKIGYIKLTQFTRPTVEKLDEALVKLQKEGMTALVFDLRNNPGGFVDSAVAVCSRFIEEDKLVVFTKGRSDADKAIMNSVESEVKIHDIPMVILINEMSASASEIVAGCLKDYKRAVLIGEKTYGKGSVQTVVNLANNGAVKFTIAKYYTPKEYVIHDNGIEPDIKVKVPSKDKKQLNKQLSRHPGELKPEVKNSVSDEQLARAIEVLNGVLIYKKSGVE